MSWEQRSVWNRDSFMEWGEGMRSTVCEPNFHRQTSIFKFKSVFIWDVFVRLIGPAWGQPLAEAGKWVISTLWHLCHWHLSCQQTDNHCSSCYLFQLRLQSPCSTQSLGLAPVLSPLLYPVTALVVRRSPGDEWMPQSFWVTCKVWNHVPSLKQHPLFSGSDRLQL